MSLSTMGAIDWRNDSERQAAAERSKSKAYKARTEALRAEAAADREALAAASKTAQSGPPPGWYDDPDGQAGKRWWDGAVWTEHRQS